MRKIGLALVALLVVVAIPVPASAALRFAACATGAQEIPPPGVVSNAKADVRMLFDPGLTQARVSVRIVDLGPGGVMGAHFHCNRAGHNGPVAFGLLNPGTCSVVNNRINCTLTNASVAASAINCPGMIQREVNNIAALHTAIEDGLIYFNLHTPAYPSGEIRGQVGDHLLAPCAQEGDDEDGD